MPRPTDVTVDRDLLGPCGVNCGYCLVLKEGKCNGCGKMSKQKAEKGETFCGIYECASEKAMDACCDCPEFPCRRYDPGADSIFSETFLKWVKETCGR
jgi:hypothetical protein